MCLVQKSTRPWMCLALLVSPVSCSKPKASWALYRIYSSLDIFIRKEQHSVSGSEGAVVLHNAKRKRHLDTDKFGLDW